MRRKNKPAAGHYYHIYNRGVNHENIFFTRRNWSFFLRRLRYYAEPQKVIIVAYCLMPNHYHLLAYLKTDEFGAEVMQPCMVSYTKAINKQQARVGPLFQGPYQAKLVSNDSYLLHLSRYIHLNPVTAGLVDTPQDWPYSSYSEFIGIRRGTLPHPDVILEQFSANQETGETGFLPDSNPTKTTPKNPVSSCAPDLETSETRFLLDPNANEQSAKNPVSNYQTAQKAYKDFVCDDDDEQSGLVDSLLFD